jgi:hypothetical protein
MTEEETGVYSRAGTDEVGTIATRLSVACLLDSNKLLHCPRGKDEMSCGEAMPAVQHTIRVQRPRHATSLL